MHSSFVSSWALFLVPITNACMLRGMSARTSALLVVIMLSPAVSVAKGTPWVSTLERCLAHLDDLSQQIKGYDPAHGKWMAYFRAAVDRPHVGSEKRPAPAAYQQQRYARRMLRGLSRRVRLVETRCLERAYRPLRRDEQRLLRRALRRNRSLIARIERDIERKSGRLHADTQAAWLQRDLRSQSSVRQQVAALSEKSPGVRSDFGASGVPVARQQRGRLCAQLLTRVIGLVIRAVGVGPTNGERAAFLRDCRRVADPTVVRCIRSLRKVPRGARYFYPVARCLHDI